MDFLSDMITRLKNGQRVGKTHIFIKYSKISLQVIQILQDEGFISHYFLTDSNEKNYQENNNQNHSIQSEKQPKSQILHELKKAYNEDLAKINSLFLITWLFAAGVLINAMVV